MRSAGVAALLVLSSSAAADVVIQSRSCEYRSWHSYPFASGGLFQSFSDVETVNQLGPSGAGVVNLSTPHNEHFISTASPAGISGDMHGSSGYGPYINRDYWGSSSWIAVLFDVTQQDIAVSVNIDGGLYPHMQDLPISGFGLTIRNLNTDQTVFDALRDAPPTLNPGVGYAVDWDHASWSGTLPVGRYLLVSTAHAEGAYSSGGGSGGYGGTSITFGVSFGPTVSPALAPTPSAGFLLAFSSVSVYRRRR